MDKKVKIGIGVALGVIVIGVIYFKNKKATKTSIEQPQTDSSSQSGGINNTQTESIVKNDTNPMPDMTVVSLKRDELLQYVKPLKKEYCKPIFLSMPQSDYDTLLHHEKMLKSGIAPKVTASYTENINAIKNKYGLTDVFMVRPLRRSLPALKTETLSFIGDLNN